jgi:hypothetical protein
VKVRNIITISSALLLLVNICKAQGDTTKNELYNKEYNWHITLPESFKRISTEDFAQMQQKGAEAMEKTLNGKIENHSKPIFVFKADQLHYFESNSQPFDPADGDHEALNKEVDGILYKTMAQQIPNSVIDSATTKETIDKLVFQRFSLAITLPNKIVMHMLMFNRLFDRKELTIVIVYVDPVKGNKLLTSLRNSRFE